jgi:hypothetical protein
MTEDDELVVEEVHVAGPSPAPCDLPKPLALGRTPTSARRNAQRRGVWTYPPRR